MSTIKTSAPLAACAAWVRANTGSDRPVSWKTVAAALDAVCLPGTSARRAARNAFCKTARVGHIPAYVPQSADDIVAAFVDAEADQLAIEKAEEEKEKEKAAEELRKQHGIRQRFVWTERDIVRSCGQADKGQPYRTRSERASPYVDDTDLTPETATTLRAAEGISARAVYHLHLPTVTLEFETDTWKAYRVTQRRPGNIIVDLFDDIEHARAWFLTLAGYPVDEPVKAPEPKIEPVTHKLLALPAGAVVTGVRYETPYSRLNDWQFIGGVVLPNGGVLGVTVNPEPVKAEEPEPASHPGLLLREILRKGSTLTGKTPGGKGVALVYDPEKTLTHYRKVPASWDVLVDGRVYTRFVVGDDDGNWSKCDDVTAFRNAREHFLKLTAKPAGHDAF